MENLKTALTERDFQLMIDGLDALSSKSQGPGFMFEIIKGSMSKDGDFNPVDFERKLKAERDSKQAERQLLLEDASILKGKLILMKRELCESTIMGQANNIINPSEK